MRNNGQTPPVSWHVRIGFAVIVLSFMALSLAVTATGTARFAVALGYPPMTGYVVGAIFDLAKAVLPVALLILLARRANLWLAFIGIAWLGLVIYSSLATHATVGLAIGSIERTGTWKVENRANAKADLAAVERRLSALATPNAPRPSATVRQALTAEKVPPGVWRRSQECLKIRRSTYFQKACATVLKLRRELAAAEDYEQLDARAKQLRERLAAAPIVATTDPLPQAFTATLGQFVPISGRGGIALLLTLVVEIMSCFGLAGLQALKQGGREKGRSPRKNTKKATLAMPRRPRARTITQRLPGSITCSSATTGSARITGRVRASQRILKVALLTRRHIRKPRTFQEAQESTGAAGKQGVSVNGLHVQAFARDQVQYAEGQSLSAADLWAAYEAWCTMHGNALLSQTKLGLELKRLGYVKWKSCGLIRYRDVQLAAACVVRRGKMETEGRRGTTNAHHRNSAQERRRAA